MALYDDDDDAGKSDKGSASANITMKFLQSQIANKRTSIQAGLQRTVVAPVVDLSARNRGGINMKVLRPVKAMAITDSAPLSFLPKAATDDSILMFGEEVIKNEYQPAVPNDYVAHKKRKEEREMKEKAAKEIADRLAREHKEEAKKREKGAAIAPPQMLIEEPIVEPAVESKSTFMPPPSFLPSFGKATTKGLGIAANIMSKFGYKQGSGLGLNEQGMSTALSVEKTGRNGGMILGEEPSASFAAPMVPAPSVMVPAPGLSAEAMKNPSKVLLLRNMVSAEEVDEELEGEIKDEMEKFGQVASIHIEKIPNAPEEEAVRIFVEFTNIAQTIKAMVGMTGRWFGGRLVALSFYNLDDFMNKQYTK